jgi:hypothetical protein
LQRQHIASYLGIHRNILTRFLYKIWAFGRNISEFSFSDK